MRDLYLAWRYSGGRLCPFRTHHGLDDEFRPLDEPPGREMTALGWRDVPPAPRPPASHRRLRNVLLAFAKLAEEESVQMAGMSMGRAG